MNIVVTGASKGIGKAIAEKFSVPGNQVFICARNENDLSKFVDETNKKSSKVIVKYFVADLADKNGVIEFGNWLFSQTLQLIFSSTIRDNLYPEVFIMKMKERLRK